MQYASAIAVVLASTEFAAIHTPDAVATLPARSAGIEDVYVEEEREQREPSTGPCQNAAASPAT
jgi:hypothetical protein